MIILSRPNWYAVQAQPRSEMKALAHLVRQGFEVYLPRFMKRRRHARRVENVPAPLFPGYLFIGIDMATQRWRCVNSTVGVQKLICNGDVPAPVSAAVIEQLRNRHDEHGFIKLDRMPQFAPGDKVRVVEGVFSSCLGLFEGMKDNQRVSILLDLLGRKARVVMDAESVAAA